LHASRIRAANAALVVGRQIDAVDEFFTPDYAGHGTARDMTGPAAVRRFVAMLREAFSEPEVDVEILMSGTQTGAFMGFPPTDRRTVTPGIIRRSVVCR